ncbi:hypothetical protein ATKI12_6600 [Kitasatospora sp. Ki12]
MGAEQKHTTAPGAEPLAALRDAVATRLKRVTEAQDIAPVFEPQAIDDARQLAAVLRDDDGDLGSRYLLGWFHWYRYLGLPEDRDQHDLHAAVARLTPCFIAGVDRRQLPEPLLPTLADQAVSRAISLLAHALTSTDPHSITATVELWQQILAATSADHPDRVGRLSNLGSALCTRFVRTGALADLDEAVRLCQEAVAATPADHPDLASMLSNLGGVLQSRFVRTGALADLDEAVRLCQEAVAATPADHPDRAGRLSNIGAALQTRFVRTGALADLDKAITTLQEAVATGAHHPNRASMLSNLGNALRTRFERTGALADLDEAVRLCQEAVAATPADHPDQAIMLSNLGSALKARFERTGAGADLDKAITTLQEAVAATPADHPNRPGYLSNLGNALMARFERTGALADLDKAITTLQEAVAATPADHPDLASMLSNLGVALCTRFVRTGALADLDKAITTLQEAVAATPADHPNRPGYLSNLGNALMARFERTGALADLGKAITTLQEAVATATHHPNRPGCLSNLGNALMARFERTGALADLDEAVRVCQEAVAATPADHPNRARMLSNLGVALQTRFVRTGALADLDEAVRVCQEAVAATPADHPDRAVRLFNLGNTMRTRFDRTGVLADLDKAITTLQEVVDVGVAPPSIRVRAARMAGLLAVGSEPGRAATLLERAVWLLPEVTPRQLEREDQQHALGGFAGLAADAAALALENPVMPAGERAALALRLLEAGRAVLLGQALETRSDLTDLTQQRPDLATRFIHLRDLLDQSTATFTGDRADGTTSATASPERAARDRRLLVGEWADLLDEIRALPEFSSFALPPTVDELLAQATEGAVVVFNVSRYRSDALLLTTRGITCLPLPGLPIDAVVDQVNTFHQALDTAGRGRTAQDRRSAQRQLSQILRWLWDNAAGPVLDELGRHAAPVSDQVWPRVWWAPGGLLGLLPIHAAGYHTEPPDPAARAVMDRVVSSYIPTVGALRHARQRPPVIDLAAARRALIVAMPTTPGVPGRLHYVLDEARKLATHLPVPAVLSEPDPLPTGPAGGPAQPLSRAASASSTLPTKDNVLGLLATCSIAHFACHGVSDPADPSRSRLLLHDHESAPLTVAALAAVRLDHAQLAYLSACETAVTTHTQLLDEAIHMASAFQLAGYPHVIGTLWAINDYRAVQIADAFYSALTTGAGNGPSLEIGQAADALHRAVRTVRQTLPTTPSLWAAHLHAGA